MKELAGTVLALILSATPTWAATYNVTSPDYTIVNNYTNCTVGTCVDYSTSLSASGNFTTSAALAANLSNAVIASDITSYSFSDGLNSFASSDPETRLQRFSVSTDSNGNITSL